MALDSTPFRLADRLRRWPRDPSRRRVAGVTALGIGGTNAHLVVAEGPPVARSDPDRQPRVVVWSAGSVVGERRLRAELGRHFAGEGADRFADVVATLQHGRSSHRVRAFTVCDSAEAAVAALAGTPGAPVGLAGTPGSAPVLTGEVEQNRDCSVAFLECLEKFEDCGVPLYQRWVEATSPDELADPGLAEPLGFAVGYSLALMWQRAGVAPVAVLGAGAGAVAASVIAGAVALPDAVRSLTGAGLDRSAQSKSAPIRVPLYPANADDPAGSPAGLDSALRALLAEQRPSVLLALGPAGPLISAAQRRPELGGAALVASLG